MGLDVSLVTGNDEEIGELQLKDNLYRQHRLSRTFCWFLDREIVVKHQPELDQIGEITNIDISIIYQMKFYPDKEYLEFELEFAKTEEEREKVLSDAEEVKFRLKDNLEKVLFIITSLIEKLSKIDNLNQLLLSTNYDSLDNEYYFSDFNLDKGDGYIDNNFGQDLRNFKRFLEFAKENGAKTAWFMFC